MLVVLLLVCLVSSRIWSNISFAFSSNGFHFSFFFGLASSTSNLFLFFLLLFFLVVVLVAVLVAVDSYFHL
jgi:hypothetical protein